MITLTRLSGSRFVLNSDLVERIDSTPDTVVTLLDGTKYVVAETLDEIVLAVRQHRSEIAAEGTRLARGDAPSAPGHLAPVSDLRPPRDGEE